MSLNDCESFIGDIGDSGIGDIGDSTGILAWRSGRESW